MRSRLPSGLGTRLLAGPTLRPNAVRKTVYSSGDDYWRLLLVATDNLSLYPSPHPLSKIPCDLCEKSAKSGPPKNPCVRTANRSSFSLPSYKSHTTSSTLLNFTSNPNTPLEPLLYRIVIVFGRSKPISLSNTLALRAQPTPRWTDTSQER